MTRLTQEQVDFILANSNDYTIKEMSEMFDVRRTLIWSCLKTNKIKAKPSRRNLVESSDVDREVVIDFDRCSITGFKYY